MVSLSSSRTACISLMCCRRRFSSRPLAWNCDFEWSVIAIVWCPRRAASSAFSLIVHRPSLAKVCVWRSALMSFSWSSFGSWFFSARAISFLPWRSVGGMNSRSSAL